MGKNLIVHIKKLLMVCNSVMWKIKTLSESGIWVPNCRKELLRQVEEKAFGLCWFIHQWRQPLYKIFCLCLRHEPRASHIRDDTPSPSITFQATDSNFFLENKIFCVSSFCRHVCLHFLCTWCPQHPEEDADSLELELQMAVIHHGAENQGRVLWRAARSTELSSQP